MDKLVTKKVFKENSFCLCVGLRVCLCPRLLFLSNFLSPSSIFVSICLCHSLLCLFFPIYMALWSLFFVFYCQYSPSVFMCLLSQALSHFHFAVSNERKRQTSCNWPYIVWVLFPVCRTAYMWQVEPCTYTHISSHTGFSLIRLSCDAQENWFFSVY